MVKKRDVFLANGKCSSYHDLKAEMEAIQQQMDKSNPRRLELTKEEQKIDKLNGLLDKLKRGENVQNRHLQTWVTEDECSKIATEWDTKKQFREELKDKPSELKHYEDKLKEAIMMQSNRLSSKG